MKRILQDHRLGGVALIVFMTLGLAPSVEAARIGVYFDPDASQSTAQVQPQQPFHFYVASTDVPGTLLGFECEVLVPAEITVTGRMLQGAGWIRVGQEQGEDNWIVGFNAGIPGSSHVNLIDYTAMLLAPAEDVSIGLGAALQTDAAFAPRYLGESDEIYDFDEVGAAFLVADAKSWGRIKTEYGDQ